MTLSTAAAEAQRPRTDVAVACEADPSLCRELVRALSEMVPARIYRIDRRRTPPKVFNLHLDLNEAGHARLRWPANGAGGPVDRAGVFYTELARQLVAARPALPDALQASLEEHPTKR